MSSLDSTNGYISNVTVTSYGGTNQMVSNSGPSNYIAFGNLPPYLDTLPIGSAITISVTKSWQGTVEPMGLIAYIDFNRNGVFEVTERVMSSAASPTPIISANLLIPNTIAANTGCVYVMRVILFDAGVGTVPCGTFPKGEVEDYGVVFVSSNLGIDEAKQSTNAIYPNPVKDFLSLKNEKEESNFEVVNSLGQVVLKGSFTKKIDVSSLSKGIYFLKYKSKEQNFTEKFIKE